MTGRTIEEYWQQPYIDNGQRPQEKQCGPYKPVHQLAEREDHLEWIVKTEIMSNVNEPGSSWRRDEKRQQPNEFLMSHNRGVTRKCQHLWFTSDLSCNSVSRFVCPCCAHSDSYGTPILLPLRNFVNQGISDSLLSGRSDLKCRGVYILGEPSVYNHVYKSNGSRLLTTT